MSEVKEIKFIAPYGVEYNCLLHKRMYENGRVCLHLLDEEDGSPVATATINLPKEELGDDEVFVKDYSENEGMLSCLIEAGIVSEPVAYLERMFVTVPKCKLLI